MTRRSRSRSPWTAVILALFILAGVFLYLSVSLIPQSTIPPCSGCLTPPSQAKLNNAVIYFTSLYNPSVGMIAEGTAVNPGANPPTFYYQVNGNACPTVAPANRFLPFESWIDAAAFQGMGVQGSMRSTIYSTVQGLASTMNWHSPWNRESMLGYIIPYSITNSNYCFTKTGGAPLPTTKTGFQYEIDQAAPWNVGTQSYTAWDNNVNHGLNNNAIDEQLFQSVNFYLRGDLTDARNLLQGIANMCTVNSDGSVGFGSAPYRGMYLGTFLEAAEIMGSPTMPHGCGLKAVQSTMWGLQQSDGGFARQYSSFTNGVLGSDDETTNAALLVYSYGVITHIQGEFGSYNLQSAPAAVPKIGI